MGLDLKSSSFKLYFRLGEEFSALLEQEGLSYASARQLSKLAVTQLRSLKKSISSISRSYFPEYGVQNVLEHINKVKKKFKRLNENIIEQISHYWDKREKAFVICDDFLIPRYTKKAFRSGIFRDPVKKKLGIGHNIVDTVIVTGGSEIVIDFELQPKGSVIPKTKRAAHQIQQALSYLRKNQTPEARIRVLMDGGYTNMTVLPSLREEGIKYLGIVSRAKKFTVVNVEKQLQDHFLSNPSTYLTINGKKVYYQHLTLNLKDFGRHQVFAVKREHDKTVKFILTNALKMTPKTFFSCLSERWFIEQNHRDLKQHCGLRQLFVRKKGSVQGLLSLSMLMKNFLALMLAESGTSFREYPLETVIEKEFIQFEQDFLQKTFNVGLMEELMMS